MKASQTLIEQLGPMAAVTSTGDLRKIVSNALLALARGEINSTDFTAMAKGLDSISASLQAEVNIAKTQMLMRQQGGQLLQHSEETELGALRIGV